MKPLGNVLEYYGGNDSKMRTRSESQHSSEKVDNLSFKQKLGTLNKHFDGQYVVVTAAKTPNIDEDYN